MAKLSLNKLSPTFIYKYTEGYDFFFFCGQILYIPFCVFNNPMHNLMPFVKEKLVYVNRLHCICKLTVFCISNNIS